MLEHGVVDPAVGREAVHGHVVDHAAVQLLPPTDQVLQRKHRPARVDRMDVTVERATQQADFLPVRHRRAITITAMIESANSTAVSAVTRSPRTAAAAAS